MRLPGEYLLDLDATARLKVGPDRDRFVTEAGFEAAIAQFVADNADVAQTTALSITPATLTLRTADGEETFPVRKLAEKRGKTTLVIDWYGQEQSFDVRDLPGGAVHLASEDNELSEYAWRKR